MSALPFLQYRFPLIPTQDGYYIGVRVNKGIHGYAGPTDRTKILTLNEPLPISLGDMERSKHDPDADPVVPKVEVQFNDAFVFTGNVTASDGVATGTTTFTSASGVLAYAQAGFAITINGTAYTVVTPVNSTTVTVSASVPSGTGLAFALTLPYNTTSSQSTLMQEVFSDYSVTYELWLDSWKDGSTLDEVWFVGDVDPNTIPKQHILVHDEFSANAIRLSEYKVTANFMIERLTSKIVNGATTGTINNMLGGFADGWLNFIPTGGTQLGCTMYAGVATDPGDNTPVKSVVTGHDVYHLTAVRYLWTATTPPPNNTDSYRVCCITLQQILNAIATFAGANAGAIDTYPQFDAWFQQYDSDVENYPLQKLTYSDLWSNLYVNANFLFGTSIPAPSDPNNVDHPAAYTGTDGNTDGFRFYCDTSAPFTADSVGSKIRLGAPFSDECTIVSFVSSREVTLDVSHSSASSISFVLPLAWKHGISGSWPNTIGRDSSVLTLLSWLALQTGCFVDFDIDVAGVVTLRLRARRNTSTTTLSYLTLNSSGEDPKMVPQSSLIVQCLGDNLQAVAGPNPKDAKTITLPWRCHKLGSPLQGGQHWPDFTELWWDKSSGRAIGDQALSTTCDYKDPNGSVDLGYRTTDQRIPTDKGWVGATMLYYTGNGSQVYGDGIRDAPDPDPTLYYSIAAITPAGITPPTDEMFGGYFNPQWAYAQFYYQELIGNRILLTQNFTGYRGDDGKIQSLKPGVRMQTYIGGALRTFNAHQVKQNPIKNTTTIQWVEVIDYIATLPNVYEASGSGGGGSSSSSGTGASTSAGGGSVNSSGSNLYKNPASAAVNTIEPQKDFVGLSHKAIASQTADFEQWQAFDGTVLAKVTKDGEIVAQPVANVVPIKVIANLTATSDLLELGNTSIAQLFKVDKDGKAYMKGGDAGGQTLTNLSPGVFPSDAVTVSQLPPAGGTVTSVDVNGGTSGLTFSGGPITTAGSISLSGGILIESYGGTGKSTYNDGDLLYGTPSGTLSTVTLGGTGQVLTALPGNLLGSVQWQDAPVLYAYSGAGLVGGSGTNYFHPNGYSAGSGTLVVTTEAIQTRNGKARNLFVQLDQPPGPGQSVTVTLWYNGTATILSASLSGAGVIASNDSIHTVNFNAGDRLTIEVVNTFGALTTQAAWGFECV